jgi:hypothetical protein
MNLTKYEASQFSKSKGAPIKELATLAEQIRNDKDNPTEVDFSEVIESKYEGFNFDSMLEDLGIDTAVDSIAAIQNLPDMDTRWIIPEIIRKAIRTGLRNAPIWPSITASESSVSQRSVTMPFINMSDAAPKYVGEAETIAMGSISYGEKEVKIRKMGRGIKISYEVLQYVSIDVIAIFFEDFGVKLGQALDVLAIDVLMNGDQADGSASAPVIGVATTGDVVYKDFLRPWVRGARMGRNFSTIIGGEAAAMDTLDLPEFKARTQGTTEATLNMKTPVPKSADYYVHGNVPDDQQILIDKRYALVKLNAIPLNIESEKIVSNQTLQFFATITTGFAKLFLDAAIILDKDLAFASNGFPDYMEVDSMLDVVIN